MNDIKVSLTVGLQGSTMLSKEECLKTTLKVIEKKSKSGKSYKKTFKTQVEDWDKMDSHSIRVTDKGGANPEIITFHTRKTKPVTQHISINQESYKYMISKECPSWSKTGAWNKMSPIQRLESHLQRIAEHFGGYMVSYKIFED